jgi:hypothetical protein
VPDCNPAAISLSPPSDQIIIGDLSMTTKITNPSTGETVALDQDG